MKEKSIIDNKMNEKYSGIECEKHEVQLSQLKKQVKALMEEAVMKKFIHEESPFVLKLCATVEQCLLDGVKRRTTGFLRSNKMANLFAKVAKVHPLVSQLITQIEDAELKLEKSFDGGNGSFLRRASIISNGNTDKGKWKHLWIRMALTTKLLDKIVDYLVQNSSKFYHPSSIISHPVHGKLFASLLVGPCALDYTKLKTQDHYWSDPPADELLQRHRLHSRAKMSVCGKRPTLDRASLRHTSSSDSLERSVAFRSYVESLHQNSKVSLLYGKNNVVVQPEETGSIPGYLSLHKDQSQIIINWTPNELMRGESSESIGIPKNSEVLSNVDLNTKTKLSSKHEAEFFWNFVISVDIRDIVYLHCHQQSEKRGTLVLVGQDGVQWPPILFPPGGHLLSFLTCLENGLSPLGCLDPPLWSQNGRGKIFPLLRRKSHRHPDVGSESNGFTDFVFRVAFTSDSSKSLVVAKNVSLSRIRSLFNRNRSFTPVPELRNRSRTEIEPIKVLSAHSNSGISRSVVIRKVSNPGPLVSITREMIQPGCGLNQVNSSNYSGVFESSDEFHPHLDMYTREQNEPRHYDVNETPGVQQSEESISDSSLETLCNSMRRQIISRAFHGWLAHCRYLASVRNNLTQLVNRNIVSAQDFSVGVTEEVWDQIAAGGELKDINVLSRYVYFGGVQAKRLRPLIWLYLLGHYPPGCDAAEREHVDQESKKRYEELRAVDQEIKEEHVGNTHPPRDFLISSVDRSSWSSGYVPAPVLQHQLSTYSDVFFADVEPIKLDKNDVTCDDVRRVTRKTHSWRDRRKRLFKRALSDDSHVPYSSISSSTTFEPYSSMSIKSISFDDEYETLQPVVEESEKSSASEFGSNSAWVDVAMGTELNNNQLETSSSRHDACESVSKKMHSAKRISSNLTQIEKDVLRCDRNYPYFSHQDNLDKLSNIMSCFVWEHPGLDYVQGMCDLAAPLLVLFNDESLVYSCFVNLMKRITFEKGNEMDTRLSNLHLLIQALDSELFEHLQRKNDQIPFFCYRWLLLEFKRELSYGEDLFAVWESCWAATSCSTPDFGLFFALAMLQLYRDVIIENDMDFPAIVKFFNEMAEKHNSKKLLQLARSLVSEVQHLIQK